ncbi:hypothetical protein ACOSP7_020207 [Xanthoceras sorbifolium]
MKLFKELRVQIKLMQLQGKVQNSTVAECNRLMISADQVKADHHQTKAKKINKADMEKQRGCWREKPPG